VDLLSGGVFLPEAELVVRYNLVSCSTGLILVRKSFSNNFERIGSKLMGL